ncbi:MAG: hypothetical protein ACPLKP_01890 [Microgenomates group bacterium]
MKKIIILIGLLVLTLAFPAIIFGQSKSSQTQNQNRIQTRNQGEEQQLQVNTQEQEQLKEGEDEGENNQAIGQPKLATPRSETARERMSEVAKAVEELLTTQGAKGGIGQQIRQVAQEQKQAQQEIEKEFRNLEQRPAWLERVIGPNYRAINNLKAQLEQNRLRIRQLEQLRNQIANKADQNQIQETIQAMIEQNTALEKQIQAKERIKSLFGWLVKLLVK